MTIYPSPSLFLAFPLPNPGKADGKPALILLGRCINTSLIFMTPFGRLRYAIATSQGFMVAPTGRVGSGCNPSHRTGHLPDKSARAASLPRACCCSNRVLFPCLGKGTAPAFVFKVLLGLNFAVGDLWEAGLLLTQTPQQESVRKCTDGRLICIILRLGEKLRRGSSYTAIPLIT